MLQIINQYLNIPGYGPCKYYKNTRMSPNFFKKSVDIGKGNPKKIASELKKGRTVGIDCSGLVCNILNTIQPIKAIIKVPPSTTLSRKIIFNFRPIENINVPVLINPINASKVKNNMAYKIWDLIHFGSEHIILIYKIRKNTLHYVQSSDIDKKVVKGNILITSKNKDLRFQNWSDDRFKKRFKNTPSSAVVRLSRLRV